MKTVNDLIYQAVGLLKNQDMVGKEYSQPYYPACIIYFGKRSALYHKELAGDITSGWGGGAAHVQYFTVNDAEAESVTDVVQEKEISVEEIQERVTELLSQQVIFEDMGKVAVYCILDTTDIQTAQEFEQWYLAIKHIKNIIGVSVLSMLVVVLNESIKYTERAIGFKKKLYELYKSADKGEANSHLYDSLFVLGNRLKNGSFVNLDPEKDAYSDYNLFADMILLTNSRGAEYTKRRSRLYGSNKPAFTAAYGYVQKPMHDIVVITLREIVKRIREMTAEQSVTADSLAVALKINTGKSAVYEQLYSDIKATLPQDDFLTLLPGKVSCDRSFGDVDRMSDGCLQAFLEQNHFRRLSAELVNHRDILEANVLGLISGNLNAPQLHTGVSDNVMNEVFAKAETGLGDAGKLNVKGAVEVKVKSRIAEEMRSIVKRAVDTAVAQSKCCVSSFKDIGDELDMINAIVEDGARKNLTSTYGQKIQRYFSDRTKLDALFKRIFKVTNTKDDILEILLEEMRSCFSSDDIYKLSYFDELTERLGHLADTVKAQEYVGDELIKNLNDKVSFHTKGVFSERIFEAYFLNTTTQIGVNKNLLFKYLEEREIPPEVERTFFNTCSNDKAESIWLYVCSEDNLQV